MLQNVAARALNPKNRFLLAAAAIIVLLLAFWSWERPASTHPPAVLPHHDAPLTDSYFDSALDVGDYLRAYPVDKSQFGQMGKRLRILKEWISYTETHTLLLEEKDLWSENINKVAASLLPFLQSPVFNQSDQPLDRLRNSFVKGSKGLVITTGRKRFRFACHLVLALRTVLGSQLPIQIAYSGEKDLPQAYREFIIGLSHEVTTLDVTTIFDDTTLDLANGGWAVKAFAILASTFEEVILLDADAVFLQKPDNIFDNHPQYAATGTMLFHDRLLWQGGFKERHEWWEKELAHTSLSSTIKQSKVYVEKYAEEGDSGVVAADKSRLDVLIGLFHIAWQNTKDVREAYTYVQGHGDKESWWFGFELTETPYSMEQHYGAITGHVKLDAQGKKENRVCSFTISHVDHEKKLLWYNGSLLKNKEIALADFDVPTEWMIDGVWEKGATKQDLSCMRDASIQSIGEGELEILRLSVDVAKSVDARLRQILPDGTPND